MSKILFSLSPMTVEMSPVTGNCGLTICGTLSERYEEFAIPFGLDTSLSGSMEKKVVGHIITYHCSECRRFRGLVLECSQMQFSAYGEKDLRVFMNSIILLLNMWRDTWLKS